MKTKCFVFFWAMCLFSHLSALEQYIGAWGGVAFARDKFDEYTIDFDLGPAGGILYGIQCPCRIRAEIEVSYRQNHMYSIRSNVSSLKISGHLKELAAMANVLYDLPVCWRAVPYLGFGIGLEREDVDVKSAYFNKIESSDSSLTGQAIVGFLYHYSDLVSFFLSYRHYLFDHDIHSGALSIGFNYRLP
ncbi:MAG: hypothetical protein Tsb0021_03410 [Chlamydiales bacterium]